ncbi:MAG: ACP S-malonyltransferase [Candidatus Chromulinivorax sp.]
MKKTVGVIFAGYGQQYVTMGKDIYDEYRDVQDLFEQASMCLGINFVQLCFASSDAEISEIDKGYLAILLLQTSIYMQLTQVGLQPDFLAGYGIGEYAAAVASGSLNFADGLYLLSKYAKLLKSFLEQNGSDHYKVLQLIRGFTYQQLELLCQELSTADEKIFIAAHTTEHGFLVAGHAPVIEKLQEYCKVHEIRKVKELHPGFGLHSQLVDSVAQALSPYFFKVDFNALKFPVITNVDGAYVTSANALESAILRSINAPLLFNEVLDGFIGCQILIFIGPGKQVAEWAQIKYPDKEIYTIENLADLKVVQAMIRLNSNELLLDQELSDSIVFGECKIDNDVISLSSDLTIADEINELPEDYDIDEDDEE